MAEEEAVISDIVRDIINTALKQNSSEFNNQVISDSLTPSNTDINESATSEGIPTATNTDISSPAITDDKNETSNVYFLESSSSNETNNQSISDADVAEFSELCLPRTSFEHIFQRFKCSICGMQAGYTLRCAAILCRVRAHPLCASLDGDSWLIGDVDTISGGCTSSSLDNWRRFQNFDEEKQGDNEVYATCARLRRSGIVLVCPHHS
jgi:hypothetical protein